DGAVCLVPRTASLHKEYRRKVRTMKRGMETLWHKRHLLNPFRYGLFAWMLFSHKVCRWLIPWTFVPALVALGVLARTSVVAQGILVLALLGGGLGAIGWVRAREHALPGLLSLPTFFLAGNVA